MFDKVLEPKLKPGLNTMHVWGHAGSAGKQLVSRASSSSSAASGHAVLLLITVRRRGGGGAGGGLGPEWMALIRFFAHKRAYLDGQPLLPGMLCKQPRVSTACCGGAQGAGRQKGAQSLLP